MEASAASFFKRQKMILPFPDDYQKPRSRTGILFERLKRKLGQILLKLGVPGPVSDIVICDQPTSLTERLLDSRYQVVVKTSALYTTISVNGRDYFFDRLTGRYDGSGLAVDDQPITPRYRSRL